jgi:glycosyltransferase involved in cell wall biosynthesis
MTLPVSAPAGTPPDASVLMVGTDPRMRGGVASVVATLRDAGLFERLGVRYVATHVDGGAARKLRRFAAAAVEAARVLARRDVAIMHAHVSSRGSFWRKAFLLWLARRFGVATIFHLHDGRFGDFAANGFGGPLLRWCIRRTLEGSSEVVVLSPRWGEWVRSFAPRSRVRVIGNPVHCPPEAALRPRAAVESGDAASGGNILFLGKLCDAKGVFDLLRAFAAFAAQHPGWRLAVGGDGEVERFLAQADALGVRDRIDYLGWVGGDDKERALAGCDVFVLPSYSEGMPVSLLEAMAYGCAVIATPVGGVPDMMTPEQHGLWVQAGDVDALAAALARAADSRELRDRLGAAARRHVAAEYSVETVSRKIAEAYADALRRRRAVHPLRSRGPRGQR